MHCTSPPDWRAFFMRSISGFRLLVCGDSLDRLAGAAYRTVAVISPDRRV